MNLPLRIFLSILIGLALAFAFSIPFLNLLQRPFLDQILLILFTTAAFGYLVFTWLESRNEIFRPERQSKDGFADALRLQRTLALPSRTVGLAARTVAGSARENRASAQREGNFLNSLNVFNKKLHWSGTAFASFLHEHVPGLVLALAFIIVYTYFGLQFNNPSIDTVDNYLDADNSSWMRRIALPDGYQMEMRGPHPFAYFIFRPLGWIFNLFTGNPAFTAILLNTLTGGLCVFLAWVFIKNQFQNRVYAFLIAALLGLSTSHLVLGSIIESYIFSAAALIGFFLLLQTRKESTGSLVALSLLTFGITLTNFVQNLIGFIVSRPRWKDVFHFGALVISLGVLLSLLHAVWYPSSKLFFLPSDAQTEEEFTISVFHDPLWRAIGRVILLIRTILLYSVVAPHPYVFTKEVGGAFPRFNFFKISPETYRFSSYSGLGNILIFAWVALLLVAGVFFIRNIIRTHKADLSLAFGLCLLFNFVLHLNYGYEPFLYSPDWAYALIFFVAFGLAPLANYRWFRVGLFAFLVLLAFNQWQFLKFVLDTISPFL